MFFQHFLDGGKDPVAAAYPSATSTPKSRPYRKRKAESTQATPSPARKQKHIDQPCPAPTPDISTESYSTSDINIIPLNLPVFHDIFNDQNGNASSTET